MHIIIKELRHTSGKVSPHFWNAEELKYQLTFSPLAKIRSSTILIT
ncbi:hypothetical protein [Chamaesiphon sp.]